MSEGVQLPAFCSVRAEISRNERPQRDNEASKRPLCSLNQAAPYHSLTINESNPSVRNPRVCNPRTETEPKIGASNRKISSSLESISGDATETSETLHSNVWY